MRNILKILLITGVLFSSCRTDKPAVMKESEDVQIVLRLKVPGGFNDSGTRGAMSIEEESTIKDVYVLIFDADTDNLVVIRGAGHDMEPDGQTTKLIIKVPVVPDVVANYKFVVIANAAEIIRSRLANLIVLDKITEAHEYADVMAKLYGDLTTKMFCDIVAGDGTVIEEVPKKIPMWCEYTTQIYLDYDADSGSGSVKTIDTLPTLTMLRSIARVDIGIGQVSGNDVKSEWTWNGKDSNGIDIPFKLTEIYIIKPNNKYLIAPIHGNFVTSDVANESKIKAITPSFADNTHQNAFGDPRSMEEHEFSYEVTNGLYSTHEIYVPEADIIMSHTGTAKYGDANHTARMAIVVGGFYNNDFLNTTYYRIDFADNNKNMRNVLRNHLYRFNISGVTAYGYDTVKEAYESISENIIFEYITVEEWGESEDVVVPF